MVMGKYRDHFDIQQGGEHGRTALHLAAIYDHEECARILVCNMVLQLGFQFLKFYLPNNFISILFSLFF